MFEQSNNFLVCLSTAIVIYNKYFQEEFDIFVFFFFGRVYNIVVVHYGDMTLRDCRDDRVVIGVVAFLF